MSHACVILAAGRGQRMGERNKALLGLGDQSFLSAIARECAAAGVQEVVVVVAQPHMAETQAAVETLGLRWVCNENPEQGMASSVARGFQFARQNFSADYCWLWPVDVPAVSTHVLLQVAAECRTNTVVIPTFGDRGGHPVLVARQLWQELEDCAQEPEGARTVFRRDMSRVVRVPVEEASVRLDVDNPDDLRKLGGEYSP